MTYSEQVRGAFALQVFAVLEGHGIPISKEMKELGSSIGNESYQWFDGIVGKAIDEAKASAPDSIKAQAKADAEKEAGLAENKTKLVEALGGRRKKKALAGAVSAGDNSDAKRAARLAYGHDSDGIAATDEDRAWLATRN